MLLQIKYFGLLTELTGCTDEQFQFSGATTSELLRALSIKYPELANKDFKVAVNQEIVENNHLIDGMEIALLPPFSGG